MLIEEELFQVIHSIPSKQTLENIDNNITYILNTVRKKIEGLIRSIPSLLDALRKVKHDSSETNKKQTSERKNRNCEG